MWGQGAGGGEQVESEGGKGRGGDGGEGGRGGGRGVCGAQAQVGSVSCAQVTTRPLLGLAPLLF